MSKLPDIAVAGTLLLWLPMIVLLLNGGNDFMVAAMWPLFWIGPPLALAAIAAAFYRPAVERPKKIVGALIAVAWLVGWWCIVYSPFGRAV